MPPHTPPSHSQAPRAPYSEAASSSVPRPSSGARASSYSSLEQALVHPVQTRDHNTDRRRHPASREPSRQLPPMPSDGRYMYQGSPDVAPQYAYPQYPPYEPAQYPPSSSRPARNNTNSHSNAPPPAPSPAAYPPPPPGYSPQAYPTAPPYGVPPQNSPQWPHDSPWPQYAQPFVPSNPPVQEQQPQTFGRPDAPPQAPGEAAGASPLTASGPSNPDNRRAEERPERSTEPASVSKARKGKDSEKAAPPPVSPVQQVLDYGKLVDSYRVILESANVIAMSGTSGRGEGVVESVEQMLRTAMYSHDILNAAVQRSTSEAAHATAVAERPPEGSEGGAGKARQLSISRPEQTVEGGQTCLGCNATSTPEWRRGPMGPRTLCNACGLVYAKLIKKRTREPGRSRGSGQSKHNPDSSGEDGSDEDSNGSQDRRSDTGDAARR